MEPYRLGAYRKEGRVVGGLVGGGVSRKGSLSYYLPQSKLIFFEQFDTKTHPFLSYSHKMSCLIEHHLVIV